MLKYAFPLVLLATGGVAQDATPFMAYQECTSIQNLANQSVNYGETILFTGSILQLHVTQNPVRGKMVFTTNQDTGTWTLIHLFDTGVGCMVANGGNFEPFIE